MSESLSLSQWLNNIEALHPSEIDLGLERVAEVAHRLSLPQAMASCTVITIAGTNGKGSCVATLEALLAQHSEQPSYGAFTSPHFIDYNERIKSNGIAVSDDSICSAFESIERARGDISLSYFEFGTLAALLIFARAELDVVILEVGLGGRLDAVNIIDPDVAIVTSIDLDHQDWLGTDLDQIGREKAGIFRSGAVAICASEDVPSTVAEYAKELGADYYHAPKDFSWAEQDGRWSLRLVQQQLDLPIPPLPPASVAAACQALALLNLLPKSDQCEQALAGLNLTGRCQNIHWQGREFILDVAHNPAASRYLARRLLADMGTNPRSLQLVFAVMADKDIAGILEPWKGQVAQVYACDLVNIPRAASAKNLYSQLQLAGFSAQVSGSVAEAVACAIEASEPGDRIVLMGSFFTVAQGLELLAAVVG